MAGYAQLEADPASHDLVLFHEYFHGETGRGLGASQAMEFQCGSWLACDSGGPDNIDAGSADAIAGKPAPTEKQISGAA